MNTFNDYIRGKSVTSSKRKAKWSIDRKNPNYVKLKCGQKVLYVLNKIVSHTTSMPYMVSLSSGGANACRTFNDAMAFVEHMLATANFDLYEVEPMKMEVKNWLERVEN